MKTIILFLVLLFPILTIAQFQADEEIIVTETQNDDLYLTGEKVKLDAKVYGDVVSAGGKIRIMDSISQDLICAGGEIDIRGYVADDIRTAGGELTIDSQVGDDLIVVGGEILITDDTIINGNLISCGGDLDIDGDVRGLAKVCGGDITLNGKIAKQASFYGGKVIINGEIRGKSKIVAETIEIGDDAKFYDDVEYWTEDGEVDFKNSLINASAVINEDLAREQYQVSWGFFGAAALSFWFFYILSVFLVLLILNLLFKNLFSKAVAYLDKEVLKSLGYGMAYLIGIPLVIIITFIILIGIPIGLLLTSLYLFSLLFGHLVVALLIVHYLDKRNDKPWNFWTVVLLALAIAMVIRLITFIPILGGIISLLIIAIAYGALTITLLKYKTSLQLST
ncbi:polymer-forming cytoskeletal protein [Aquimarina sp. MMG016]|uniref:polymer-forming cytoskeletal protein n=1 Tax=Aquimarina sp. MMG016 TaxID=2822690 RepID=UPI001B3A5C2C|nr:polymer-forming cytoskeletal protein [Aquimarina sp. MMG016]MBQ4819678.1 hypothetical protein [Aquimarina sp. MMG016]